MHVYVFDKRWRRKGDGTGKRKATYTSAAHPKNVVVSEMTVDESHTIATISVFITKHAKNQKITLLRLCSHGNAGYMELGTGRLQSDKVFAHDAVVELHGCGVASATPLIQDPDGHYVGYWKVNGKGHRFLKALAKTLGVAVRGAVEGQLSDRGYAYEYQSVTVMPNGETTVAGHHSKEGKKK
jgi:hypothetical protein